MELVNLMMIDLYDIKQYYNYYLTTGIFISPYDQVLLNRDNALYRRKFRMNRNKTDILSLSSKTKEPKDTVKK